MKRTNISVITALLLGLAAGMTTGCFKGFEAAKPSAGDLSVFNKGGEGDGDKDVSEDPGGNEFPAGEGGSVTEQPGNTDAPETAEIPADLQATQPSTPFIPADRAEGQTFVEAGTSANSASIIASNDQLLAGEKDEQASKLIKALTIQIASGANGIDMRLEAAVVTLIEDGTLANRLLTIDTSVSGTPIKYIENGEVTPLQVNLQKDVQDLTGVPALNSIVAYAICKDVACAVIQIRLDFQVPGGVISAIFLEQMVEGGNGYVLAGSNLSADLSTLPSFKSHTDAQLAALNAPAAPAEGDQGDGAEIVDQQQAQTVAQPEAPKMDPAVDANAGSLTWDKFKEFIGVKATPPLPQGTPAQEAAMDKLPVATTSITKPAMQIVEEPAATAAKPLVGLTRAEQMEEQRIQREIAQKAAKARAEALAAEAAKKAAAEAAAKPLVGLTRAEQMEEQRIQREIAQKAAQARAAAAARKAAADAAAKKRFELNDQEQARRARAMGLN